MSHPARAALAAAVLYLAVALFANRAVLADPFTLLPTPTQHVEAAKPRFRLGYEADQRFVVGYIARVARAVALEPSEITDTGLCAPMSRAYTLGEHMFGQGLLGALPYLAARDPIFTFNAVTITTTWISMFAMYALAFYWTRSFPAALLAGLLFGLHPNRLNNPAHMFVFGNAWSAFALLAVHRLFARQRWIDAALLTLFLWLQLLESFYPILSLAIVGGTYTLCLAAKHTNALPRLAPKLVAIAILAAGFAWLVLGPYLEAQGTWEILGGRNRMLLMPEKYLPGAPASPGWILFVLAALGLLDRLRGPRHADDPRLPLLLAGFLLFWCSVWYLSIPGLGRLASPLVSLASYIPGVEAVRALSSLQFTVFLVLTVFAAYAVLAIVELLPSRAAALVTVLGASAILVQTFHPPTAHATFQAQAGLQAVPSRPPDDELALLEKLPDGAVLDVPLNFAPMPKLRMMPGYLLAAGYYEQPTAACYNSFLSGIQAEVERLTETLPDRRAADALSALGFRSIRVHHDRLGSRNRELAPFFADPKYTELLGQTDQTSLFRLTTAATTEDFAAIAETQTPPSRALAERARDEIVFRFARGAGPTFRHPDPIEPSDVLVRWHGPTGDLILESPGRMLLPPALSSHDHSDRPIEVAVPNEQGPYRADLVRAAAPEVVLARRYVSVR